VTVIVVDLCVAATKAIDTERPVETLVVRVAALDALLGAAGQPGAAGPAEECEPRKLASRSHCRLMIPVGRGESRR
jgi:hypothetical protein